MSFPSDILSPDDQAFILNDLESDMNVVSIFHDNDSLNEPTEYNEEDYKKNIQFISPLPVVQTVLSNEEHLGPYEFEVCVCPNGSKNAWVYSPSLNKVYMNMCSPFPVDFRIKNRPPFELFIRTTPVYSSPQFSQECVYRCINHEYSHENSNRDIAGNVRQHIIRCANTSAMYLGDKNKNERLSVVIPFSLPQTGTDAVREMFEFVCKNSCPTPGMNRRAIEVIFTLEDVGGNILGRQTLNVRVCSCPKRDKEKDEKDNLDKAKPSRGKKRKLDKPEKIHVTSDDTKEYPITLTIVGKHNLQQVLKYCHDLMAGEIIRHMGSNGHVHYKKCLDDINTLIKEQLD